MKVSKVANLFFDSLSAVAPDPFQNLGLFLRQYAIIAVHPGENNMQNPLPNRPTPAALSHGIILQQLQSRPHPHRNSVIHQYLALTLLLELAIQPFPNLSTIPAFVSIFTKHRLDALGQWMMLKVLRIIATSQVTQHMLALRSRAELEDHLECDDSKTIYVEFWADWTLFGHFWRTIKLCSDLLGCDRGEWEWLQSCLLPRWCRQWVLVNNLQIVYQAEVTDMGADIDCLAPDSTFLAV